VTAPRPGEALAAGLLDPALWAGDPHPLLRQLRRQAPVAWHAGRGFWAVSRHADVLAVESDPHTFCSGRGILTDEIGTTYDTPPTMMHTDPPRHTRYRRLVQPGFRPTLVRALAPAIRRGAEALVAAIPAGRPVDVLAALAVPLPIDVIGEVLGVPDEDRAKVHDWSEAAIPGSTDWPPERRAALMADMVGRLMAATEQRRRAPRQDVLSALATAELDGERLSTDELVMFLVQLLVAGNETTRNLIAGGLVALADAPDQWERLRAEPVLVPTAVEELLRVTTPVIAFLRTATADAEVGGCAVASGEPLLLLFASANRDEAVFGDDSDRLDVGRDPNPHLAFGFGPHFCLGAALARLEAAIVLEVLLERFASLGRAGAVERSPSSVIAGLKRAELRFTAA
jgi:cytochrome P450